MLSSNLQSILTNRLRYLPEITGKAINSIDWPSQLIVIGKHYGLHVDELEDFQAVVMKAMVGMISPDKFQDELITALALSPVNAEKVLMEVNDKIFEPIHEFVMSNGQARDPLKAAGIAVEVEAPVQASPSLPTIPVPRPAPAQTTLEIPASPEPVAQVPQKTIQKPQVSGNFDAFFAPAQASDQGSVLN